MVLRGMAPIEGQRDEQSVSKGICPGKRTLTASLPVQRRALPSESVAGAGAQGGAVVSHHHEDPFSMHFVGDVQRAAVAAGEVSNEAVHAAAARGISGASGALPHAAAIQRSFGSFDIGGIRSHTVGAAADGAAAMGARAFAMGNHVAFGPGAADLHTAAHEAAHVIQQRAGVQLAGGVGAEGDAFERHADAVADKVVAGESAEALLAAGPGGGFSSGGAAVQRVARNSAMGTFTDEKYELDGARRLHLVLKFTPGNQVDATKIGLTQSLKDMKDGAPNSIDATARSRKSQDGHAIDRLSDKNTPIYGSESLGPNQGLDATAPTNNPTGNATELNPDNGRNATYELGHRTNNAGVWDVKDAGLYDGPTIVGGPDSSKEFESAAVALEGPQQGQYYGSVRWGWRKDAAGALSMIPFDIVSMGTPSKEFLGAATMWNAGKVRGTLGPIANGTSVVDDTGAVLYTIDVGTEMTQLAPVALNGIYHLFVEITNGQQAVNRVYVRTDEVEDLGDGADLVRLPVPQVKVLTRADSLYRVAWKQNPLMALPQGARVKVTLERTAAGLSKIEILDGPNTGQIGWTVSNALVDE